MNEETHRQILWMDVPYIPPTVNKCYVNNRYTKGRFLSPLAATFKTDIKSYISQNYLKEIGELNPKGLFSVHFYLYMSKGDLINKTFGKKSGHIAKTKYKKLDISNRVKILEDALSEILGIDDSQFFSVGSTKLVSDKVFSRINIVEIDECDISPSSDNIVPRFIY